MITIDPITSAALGHRALHIGAANSVHVVALSKEGIGSLLTADHLTVTRFQVGCQVDGIALSPDGEQLAILGATSMSLVDLPGLAGKVRVEDCIEGCLFSPSGKLLWTTLHSGNDVVVLEVRDSKSCATIARTEVPDPFESSALMLFNHPSEDRVALWVAARQDGQCLYWGHYDGCELTTQRFPDLTDTTPPYFDHSGKRFLVVSGGCVRLYEFSTGSELGRIPWPLANDPPAETVAFIGDEHALVHSGNGRLLLISLRQMQIVEEISIRGHEPRPIRELYPNLPRNLDLCSDLTTFMPLPSGAFLSVHQELPSKSIADWRDQLLTWKIPYA
jgi:hypothetical protein